MKRCSTCNRTYSDPNLSFCIEDGTPLTPVEDESTVVSPPYQPPGSYVPPGTQVPRRRVWPWVVGILGAFILGIVVLSIAAVILAPRFLRARQNGPITVYTREAENSNSPAPPANANVDTANANANVNANAANGNVDTLPPPTDRDEVMAQLRDLENDWTLANINDDKKALERILADDWVGQLQDGGIQGKADYIRTNRRDVRVEKWDFDDLKLNLIGDRASLSGKIKLKLRDEDDLKFDFLDKFVWRDGRWQATGSEVKPRD